MDRYDEVKAEIEETEAEIDRLHRIARPSWDQRDHRPAEVADAEAKIQVLRDRLTTIVTEKLVLEEQMLEHTDGGAEMVNEGGPSASDETAVGDQV